MRFDEVLAKRLRHTPGNPLITFYDDATGERTELSATTYGNWVAKTANVLIEELDMEPGASVQIATGVHWLTPIFMGAAWLTGMQVQGADGPNSDPDAELLLVGGPDVAERPNALACSLHPFGLRFPEPIPAHDFGSLWPNQPDIFLGDPYDSSEVRAEPSNDRVLTDLDPTLTPAVFTDLLAGAGSVVLVRNPQEARWPARQSDERATKLLRAD